MKIGGGGFIFISVSVSESISIWVDSVFSVSFSLASAAYLFEDVKVGLFFLIESAVRSHELEERFRLVLHWTV